MQRQLLRRIGTSVFSWALFFLLWSMALDNTDRLARTTLMTGVTLGLLVVVVTLVCQAWVRHNVMIASRGQRNRSSRWLPAVFPNDWLGRTLQFPPREHLHSAAEIEVAVNEAGTAKLYRRAARRP